MKNNIFTYLLILLLPMIAGIFMYHAMQGILEQECIREYESELSGIADMLDDQLEQANALSTQLSDSRRLRNYQMSLSLGEKETAYAAYEVLGEFSSVRSAYNGISAFFVWFSRDDSVLCRTTRMYAEEFFNDIYICDDKSDLFSYTILSRIVPTNVFSPKYRFSQPYLPYVSTLSLPYSNRMRYANLVVLFDVKSIENFISKSELASCGWVSVLDRDGNELFSAGAYPKDNDNILKLESLCTLGGLSVHAGIPHSVTADKTQIVRTRFILLLAALFLVELAIALTTYLKNYRTLRRTAELFDDYDGQRSIDLKYIYAAAKKVTALETEARMELSKTRPILHESMIKNIFAGIESESGLETLGFDLSSGRFGVGLLVPNEWDSPHLEQAISKILSKTFGNSILYTVDMKNKYVMFLMSGFDAEKCALLQSIMTSISGNARICTSSVFCHIELIQKAFQQAFLQLEESEVPSDGSLSGAGHGYPFFDYPIEEEYRLMNLVRAGNAQDTENLLNDIVSRSASAGGRAKRGLKSAVSDTAMNLLNELNRRHIGDADLFALTDDFLLEQYITEQNSIPLFRHMAVLFGENNAKTESVSARVIEYVRENYTDVNCSVSMIAAYMGLNSSYLSTVFKMQVGENLSDYIAYMRIELAKHILLDHPAMPIVEIAEHTGFASETVLTRTFKRQTGLTPGRYRTISINK